MNTHKNVRGPSQNLSVEKIPTFDSRLFFLHWSWIAGGLPCAETGNGLGTYEPDYAAHVFAVWRLFFPGTFPRYYADPDTGSPFDPVQLCPA